MWVVGSHEIVHGGTCECFGCPVCFHGVGVGTRGSEVDGRGCVELGSVRSGEPFERNECDG